jgi:hypothetical protein
MATGSGNPARQVNLIAVRRSGFVMDTTGDEKELIRRLVFAGHISVPERRALPDRKAKVSLIYSVVEEALQSGAWFRAWWLPDDSMIGCEISYRGDDPARVCWT